MRLANRFNIGGPIWNIAFLTKYLSPSFETKLIGGSTDLDEGNAEFVLTHLDIPFEILPSMRRRPSFFSDLKALIKLICIIRKYKPQIVHTHAAKAGTLGRIAAIFCRVPILVHTFHGHVFSGYFGKTKTRIYIQIERLLARFTTQIIAISPTQKQELSEIYRICHESKIKIIPLGFDLQKFDDHSLKRNEVRKKYGVLESEFVIAIIGRITEIKNHAFFFECALKLLKESQIEFKFFIVGDGHLKEQFITSIESKHPEYIDRFIFTSWIENMETFYPAVDLVCLCSKNEGTPVSLIEAQACGIPVVSTNVGGVKDIISDGHNGFLIEPGNIQDFAGKITELTINKNLYLKMSQNGIMFVSEKFSYKRLVSDVENLYYNLINEQ